MKVEAIVIGAGPNGLTAAAALAKRGKRVVVLEAADAIGGHTRPIAFGPDCRFSLSEDRGWVPDNVARMLGLQLRSVAHSVSASIVVDGALISAPTDLGAAGELIAKHSKRDAARFVPFAERISKFAGVLGRVYQLPPADIDTTSLRDLLPLAAVGLKVRMLGRADMTEFLRVMPMSVQDLVDDEFETEWLKALIASAAVRGLRQGPRSGGTTFNLIHHMVGGSARAGGWFAEGPDAFAVAVAKIVTSGGSQVRTGARVARILVRDDAVAGVVLAGGEEVLAPIVISTADPKRTLLDLVEPQWLDPEIGLAVSNIKLRGCTAFVTYAVDAAPPDAFKAPVSLTPTTIALERAADAAKYGEIAAEPHIECWSPSLRWPAFAPAGQHIIVARVHYAPFALKSAQWDQNQRAALEKKVSAALGRVIPGFSGTVKRTGFVSPRDIEEHFLATEGALTQGEMTLDQIMFMRPIPGWGRYAMPIRGLFLGGTGAHPGPGMLGGAGFLAAKAAR